jgi:uncharacterized membrane protein
MLVFILIMSSIAWLRRRRLPPEDRFGLDFRFSLSSLSRYWAAQKRLDKVLAGILVVAILAAVGTLAYVVATPRVGEKYTEFYILGANGKAADYPRELASGQSGRVTVGIINHEQTTTLYRVEIAIDGQKVNDIAPFNLADEEKREQPVAFKPGSVGTAQKLEFLLYKGDGSEPSDTLHIWIDVKP